MNELRDPLVGDALRRLDVPDHAPDFWSRLDAGLAGGPTDASEDSLDGEADDDGDRADVVELDAARAARADRSLRGRAPRVAAVAAAAAAAIALAVGIPAAQQAADGDAQVDMAEAPDDPAPDAVQPAPDAVQPAPDTPATSEETTTTTAPDPTALLLEAEETAGEWLTLLRAGDVEGAHALLDDASRARLSLDAFRELASGLAEGAAAFAGDGVTATVAVLDAADASLAVVTFAGEVEREGMVETASYPVVVTASGVHFVVDGPLLELDPEYARSSGTTLTAPLEVLVSDTADTWLWIDGNDPERFLSPGRLTLGADAIGPGTHVVTLVAIEGGAITARSYTVVVP